MSDMNMDRINTDKDSIVRDNAGQFQEETPDQGQPVSMIYLLNQINRVMDQTDYLHEAIDTLSKMSDGECGEAYSAGNIMGQAKAHALKDIVCYRETTNQQVLRMYEKMYDDLYGRHTFGPDRTDCSRERGNSSEMTSEVNWDQEKRNLMRAVEDVIYAAKVTIGQEE